MTDNGSVEIKIEGLEKAQRELSLIPIMLSYLNTPFQRCRIYMFKSWGDSFMQGGRGGRKWTPNSSATAIIKSGTNPLMDTGLLRASLTSVFSRNYTNITKSSLELGTTMPYAVIQDKGFEITVTQKMRIYMAAKHGIILGDVVRIPARPFMFFTDQDIAEITKIFNMWIQEVLLIAGK